MLGNAYFQEAQLKLRGQDILSVGRKQRKYAAIPCFEVRWLAWTYLAVYFSTLVTSVEQQAFIRDPTDARKQRLSQMHTKVTARAKQIVARRFRW